MYQEMFDLHAALLKAMSHPKRLEIVQLLRNQTLNVGEIVEMLGLPQANLSQHLTVLREAGVVESKKTGKEVYYQLANKKFVEASDLFRDILVERHEGGGLADEFSIKMKDLMPIVTDVVCGMRVSPKTAAHAIQHKGGNFYFCGKGCLDKFEKQPDKYKLTN